MNEFIASLVIQWYEDIEQRLLDVLSFIPFIPTNYKMFSPRFPGLLTETCDVLDSLLRKLSKAQVRIGGKIRKRKDLTIGDYGWLYARRLKLPDTYSFAFVSPPVYLTPFQIWSSTPRLGQPYPPPPWWTVYNKQKHSRLQDVKKATLKVTVEALCGLHQVIVRSPELAEAVLRHGWAQTRNNFLSSSVLQVLKKQHSATQSGDTFFVETKLFAVPIGKRSFPPNIADIRALDYSPDGLSPRLSSFLGQ